MLFGIISQSWQANLTFWLYDCIISGNLVSTNTHIVTLDCLRGRQKESSAICLTYLSYFLHIGCKDLSDFYFNLGLPGTASFKKLSLNLVSKFYTTDSFVICNRYHTIVINLIYLCANISEGDWWVYVQSSPRIQRVLIDAHHFTINKYLISSGI